MPCAGFVQGLWLMTGARFVRIRAPEAVLQLGVLVMIRNHGMYGLNELVRMLDSYFVYEPTERINRKL